ncbi:hypothetical protein V1264_010086 [Littorina saxatilis]
MVAQCFASLPAAKMMPRPRRGNDSYATETEEGVAFVEYSVTTVQRQPIKFCDSKDDLIKALDCMTSSMMSQCPDMPDEMLTHNDRLVRAFNGYCNRVDEVNAACMRTQWMVPMTCKRRVMDDMRNNGSSMQPGGSGGGMKQSPPPPPPPTTQTMPGSEPPAEGGPGPEPKPEMGGDKGRQMICNFQYRMMRCVKTTMKACPGGTADVMAELMKNMATASCAAMMDTWAAQVTGDNCQGSDCGAASGLSVAGTLGLLPVFLCIYMLV